MSLGLTDGRAERAQAAAERGFAHRPGDLPPPDIAFAPLFAARVPPEAAPGPAAAAAYADFAARSLALAAELVEQPEVVWLHAILCMALRREGAPEAARALFFRLWDEEAPRLLPLLDTRWRLSAAQSFADHGRSEAERRLGGEMALLFGLLKITESERRFSGLGPAQPFAGPPVRAPLPYGLSPMALTGDLPRNLLVRLWRRAQGPGPMPRIARALLERLDAENAGPLFRLSRMARDSRKD